MSREILYLTVNDAPSGIYRSQVLDVCQFLSERFKVNTRLLALLPLPHFMGNRNVIKAAMPKAAVIPMVPGLINWRLNAWPAFGSILFRRPEVIIARGPWAARIAQQLKAMGLARKVVYDGRGAFSAEIEEYRLIPPHRKRVIRAFREAEKRAVLQSDYRIAVTEQLVNYWRREFGYADRHHVIIPCLLSSQEKYVFRPEEAEAERKKHGFGPNDIVFAYSGSTAEWQSFSLIVNFLKDKFTQSPNAKALFLARPSPALNDLAKAFPGRIITAWVKPEEAIRAISAADYGLMLREASVTNRVASPTKVAEYLYAGLPVIISDEVGDYSGFVVKNQCGFTLQQASGTRLGRPSAAERLRCHTLAAQQLTKEAHAEQYAKMLTET